MNEKEIWEWFLSAILAVLFACLFSIMAYMLVLAIKDFGWWVAPPLIAAVALTPLIKRGVI